MSNLTVLVNTMANMTALKTAAYILNKVSTKTAAKTPYELWVGQKPSLKHFHRDV